MKQTGTRTGLAWWAGFVVAGLLTLTACSAAPSLPNAQQIASRFSRPCGPFTTFDVPDWSPDGTRIVYVARVDDNTWDGDTDIWTMTSSGKGARQLTKRSGRVGFPKASPVWSPDGASIAFVSQQDGNPEIYRMNGDGTQQVRLTDNPAEDSAPLWSPDGKRIAFYSGRDGQPYKIYVMNSDGRSQTPLVGVTEFENMVWTPDGNKLIYGAWHEADGYGIDAVDTHSGAVTRLTDANVRGAFWPSVSPDGRRIAFSARDADNDLQIYVMNADGTDVTQLTHDGAYYRDPAWSPDGKRIAYLSSYGHLLVMNGDGTEQRQLTHDIRWSNPFVWSPDSKRIVLVVWPSETVSELYMIDVDAGFQQALSDNPGSRACLKWPF